MSEYKWKADAFDAIRIVAAHGEFDIVGEDTDEILLEGEHSSRHRFGGEPTVAGRWLELHPFGGGSEWSFTLPTSKAWVIEIMGANAEVKIEDVHARITAQLGRGEVHLENCRGVFNIRSGSGDVRMENCAQSDAPAAPEHVQSAQAEQPGVPPMPPKPGMPGLPPIPPIPPIPPVGKKIRLGKHITIEGDDEWEEFGQQWEDWGERFAEQASRWAENFSREFGGMFKYDDDQEVREDGIHVRLGSGDFQIEEIDAQYVTARVGSGDIQMEEGRIAELDVETSRGEIETQRILPTGAWQLTTRHGDIQLYLPGDTYARVDAATRHGEIECSVPLVRVGRPGPGARHGGRMVGTIGEGSGEAVEIHLESQHGDLDIQVEKRASRYAGQSAPPSKKQERDLARREPPTSAPVAQPASNAVVPVTVTDLSEPEAALNPPAANTRVGNAGVENARHSVQVYDSQMAILQALQAGEITVAEAEMLLRSLKS